MHLQCNHTSVVHLAQSAKVRLHHPQARLGPMTFLFGEGIGLKDAAYLVMASMQSSLFISKEAM